VQLHQLRHVVLDLHITASRSDNTFRGHGADFTTIVSAREIFRLVHDQDLDFFVTIRASQ
jgi:hypothetical protein